MVKFINIYMNILVYSEVKFPANNIQRQNKSEQESNPLRRER